MHPQPADWRTVLGEEIRGRGWIPASNAVGSARGLARNTINLFVDDSNIVHVSFLEA